MVDPYAAAGVDIAAGDEAVRRIAPHAARTTRPEVVGGLGGFGAAFALDPAKWRAPLLVSATDGVGTKLLVAQAVGRLDTVGIDLVAMCVNDIACCGAEPLFFLDYVATGALDPSQVEQLVAGIADGCVDAGCALVGGETAELPGMYAPGSFDLAGFTVGVVERDERLGPHNVEACDVLVGIASSGLHSNGYSLARRVLLELPGRTYDEFDGRLGRTLGEELLEPTRIYVRALRSLVDAGLPVRAAAHITGGGLVENVPRVLPDGWGARIDTTSWERPAVFDALVTDGELDVHAAHRTFNMGIGMVLVVAADAADGVIDALTSAGERAWHIGAVTPDRAGVELVGATP
ncbi:MAG: phosphoribosylformylglycinamidine cyclo-ligase [Thermoleophilia bacterium]|nr:phosphoribosylformylglycinamidine cyclo-ligase [Thermoleophilia bacterium]